MSTARKKAAPAKKHLPAKPTPKSPRPELKNPSVGPRPGGPPCSEVGLDDLKGLIAMVAKEAFQEFEFEAGSMKFRIRKDGPQAAPQVTYAPAPAPMAYQPPMTHMMPPQAPMAAPVFAAAAPPAAPLEEAGIHYITSPIVGTYYRSANPTSAPFVQTGDRIRPGQTLCIVEAMKLMNEIESDVAGEIIRVLVDNGQPVEYGERLYAVKVS
jgi:acetyl-CoA carboxylase biotin carboxyl carrier protein